jgi:hypothetical protein
MSQWGLCWWILESVYFDRAGEVSAREDEGAIGNERKVPNAWRESSVVGYVLWRESTHMHSVGTPSKLTRRGFPVFQFHIMRPGFSIQKKMARTSSAMAMNEFVITNGRLHVWVITGLAASGWGL